MPTDEAQPAPDAAAAPTPEQVSAMIGDAARAAEFLLRTNFAFSACNVAPIILTTNGEHVGIISMVEPDVAIDAFTKALAQMKQLKARQPGAGSGGPASKLVLANGAPIDHKALRGLKS